LFFFLVSIFDNNCEFRPNGIRFTAGPGTFEFATKWSPMVGDIVTFKHRGFLHTSKKPKLPALYRVRRELTWEDVKQQFEEPKAALQGMLPLSSNNLLDNLITLLQRIALPIPSHPKKAQRLLARCRKSKEILYWSRNTAGLRSLRMGELALHHSNTSQIKGITL